MVPLLLVLAASCSINPERSISPWAQWHEPNSLCNLIHCHGSLFQRRLLEVFGGECRAETESEGLVKIVCSNKGQEAVQKTRVGKNIGRTRVGEINYNPLALVHPRSLLWAHSFKWAPLFLFARMRENSFHKKCYYI